MNARLACLLFIVVAVFAGIGVTGALAPEFLYLSTLGPLIIGLSFFVLARCCRHRDPSNVCDLRGISYPPVSALEGLSSGLVPAVENISEMRPGTVQRIPFYISAAIRSQLEIQRNVLDNSGIYSAELSKISQQKQNLFDLKNTPNGVVREARNNTGELTPYLAGHAPTSLFQSSSERLPSPPPLVGHRFLGGAGLV